MRFSLKEKLADAIMDTRGLMKIALGLVAITLFWLGSVYMVQEPDKLDVGIIQKESNGLLGYTTTRTMEEIIETLLEQPLGYVSNDIAPPFIFLDNRPSWELGVVKQLQFMALAMQDEFSRSNAQSTEDPNLQAAQSLLRNDHEKWIMVDYQDRLKNAKQELETYRRRLMNENPRDGQFVSHSTALSYWLKMVNKSMGSLSQKLSASRGELQVNTDLVGEAGGKVAWADSYLIESHTPWLEVDNVFYEARGQAWAMLSFFKAIRVDFDTTLSDKQATAIVDQIIKELEYALQPIYSPYVFNGSRYGYGFTPNYSLRLSSDITRATNGIRDLINLLSNG